MSDEWDDFVIDWEGATLAVCEGDGQVRRYSLIRYLADPACPICAGSGLHYRRSGRKQPCRCMRRVAENEGGVVE